MLFLREQRQVVGLLASWGGTVQSGSQQDATDLRKYVTVVGLLNESPPRAHAQADPWLEQWHQGGPTRINSPLCALELGNCPLLSPSKLPQFISANAEVDLNLQTPHVSASLGCGQKFPHRIQERRVGGVEVGIDETQTGRAPEQRRQSLGEFSCLTRHWWSGSIPRGELLNAKLTRYDQVVTPVGTGADYYPTKRIERMLSFGCSAPRLAFSNPSAAGSSGLMEMPEENLDVLLRRLPLG